jgi:pimeloyl-ACP methyl ester carboxylesterase
MTQQPKLIKHRQKAQSSAAIVFIHGFSGDLKKTWGRFPNLLMVDPRLDGWSILSYGYDTGLQIDMLQYLWSSDPSIDRLAESLVTSVERTNLKPYKTLCFIAHSMGGLVLQRALVDSSKLVDKTSHVVLFGTPSNGLIKARFGTLLKPQLKQMTHNSDFIKDLRARWTQRFSPKQMPFRFVAVAGYNDEFVPRTRSLTSFPPSQTAMIPGNHLSIVKPQSPDDPSIAVVSDLLAAGPTTPGVADTARVACDIRSYRETIAQLSENVGSLDRKAVMRLAMAYDALGETGKATQVLELAAERDIDAKGALAGRYKRMWKQHHRQADAEMAETLYGEAYQVSVATQQWEQAFYHGINLAFLAEVFRGKEADMQQLTRSVLKHCTAVPLTHRYGGLIRP